MNLLKSGGNKSPGRVPPLMKWDFGFTDKILLPPLPVVGCRLKEGHAEYHSFREFWPLRFIFRKIAAA